MLGITYALFLPLLASCSPEDADSRAAETREYLLCHQLWAPDGTETCLSVAGGESSCIGAVAAAQNSFSQPITRWEKFSAGLIITFRDGSRMPLWSQRINCIEPPFKPLTDEQQMPRMNVPAVAPSEADAITPDTERDVAVLEAPPSQASEPWLIELKERQAINCEGDTVRNRVTSLDGNFEYLEVCSWPTSGQILQRRLTDGRLRPVVDGSDVRILRNGPWRGFLVVYRHKILAGGESFYPVSIVRHDGREMLDIPGSDTGDRGLVVEKWLRAKGWVAE
jgi:hypothetical protein